LLAGSGEAGYWQLDPRLAPALNAGRPPVAGGAVDGPAVSDGAPLAVVLDLPESLLVTTRVTTTAIAATSAAAPPMIVSSRRRLAC
jgi:hypothetical protein